MKGSKGQIAMVNMDTTISGQQFALLKLKKNIEDHLAVLIAWAFVVVLLGAAVILGFPQKELADKIMLFVTNSAHNPFYIVYLITAIGLIVLASLREKILVKFMRSIGKIYVLTGVIGFVLFDAQANGHLVSIINFCLGISIAVAGWLLQDYRQRLLVAGLIAKQRDPEDHAIMRTLKNSCLKLIKTK